MESNGEASSRRIDWIEPHTVKIDSLIPTTPGKPWKIEWLREIFRAEGRFRTPLIVDPKSRVLVGNNRLHALRAEGFSGDMDVLMVGCVAGLNRAIAENS